jgi:hypothetical protein
MEGDSSWPALAAQLDKWCGTLGALPAATLEVKQMVLVEEQSSVCELTRGHSACRLPVT